jgi:hypothetical protein
MTMQTLKIKVDNSEDLQFLKELLSRLKFVKEITTESDKVSKETITNDLKESLTDVKNGNIKPINSLFDA